MSFPFNWCFLFMWPIKKRMVKLRPKIAVVTGECDKWQRGCEGWWWSVEECVRILSRQNEWSLVERVEIGGEAAPANAVSANVRNGNPDFIVPEKKELSKLSSFEATFLNKKFKYSDNAIVFDISIMYLYLTTLCTCKKEFSKFKSCVATFLTKNLICSNILIIVFCYIHHVFDYPFLLTNYFEGNKIIVRGRP